MRSRVGGVGGMPNLALETAAHSLPQTNGLPHLHWRLCRLANPPVLLLPLRRRGAPCMEHALPRQQLGQLRTQPCAVPRLGAQYIQPANDLEGGTGGSVGFQGFQWCVRAGGREGQIVLAAPLLGRGRSGPRDLSTTRQQPSTQRQLAYFRDRSVSRAGVQGPGLIKASGSLDPPQGSALPP